MWIELALMVMMVVAFGFVAPYIGDRHFQDAMPDLCVSNYSYAVSDCAYGVVECKIGWYFWCLT